jgi:hypothetical protein
MNSKRLTTMGQGIVSTDAPDLGQLAGLQYAFIVSGCVWTADSSGATLNGSMTAGTVSIKGILLTVASVSAHAFTASKDTYVDFTDNGDGTAAITYTAVANNAMSPALTGTNVYDTIRNAIIVSTGSALTTGASTINQGIQFAGPATTAQTSTVASGSNGNNITTSTLSIAANSLAAAGLAKVVCSNAPAGFEAVIAYTSGGGTTTLSGITVLSGNGTVATGNTVTQIANWAVCDGLGNLIYPTRPYPGVISFGIKAIGALTTTQTSTFSPVANLTRRFIVPPGPNRQVKVSGNVTYISSSATAGTTYQGIIQIISTGVATGVGVAQGEVSVASDGQSMHPSGVAQLSPGTYQVALICQQGAAGTLTVDATFLASSVWVELV